MNARPRMSAALRARPPRRLEPVPKPAPDTIGVCAPDALDAHDLLGSSPSSWAATLAGLSALGARELHHVSSDQHGQAGRELTVRDARGGRYREAARAMWHAALDAGHHLHLGVAYARHVAGVVLVPDGADRAALAELAGSLAQEFGGSGRLTLSAWPEADNALLVPGSGKTPDPSDVAEACAIVQGAAPGVPMWAPALSPVKATASHHWRYCQDVARAVLASGVLLAGARVHCLGSYGPDEAAATIRRAAQLWPGLPLMVDQVSTPAPGADVLSAILAELPPGSMLGWHPVRAGNSGSYAEERETMLDVDDRPTQLGRSLAGLVQP